MLRTRPNWVEDILNSAEEIDDDSSIEELSDSSSIDENLYVYKGKDRKYFPCDPFDEWETEKVHPAPKKDFVFGLRDKVSNRTAIAALEKGQSAVGASKYNFQIFSDRVFLRYYRWHEKVINFGFNLAKAIISNPSHFDRSDLQFMNWFMYGFHPLNGYDVKSFWRYPQSWKLPKGSHFQKGKNVIFTAIRLLSKCL